MSAPAQTTLIIPLRADCDYLERCLCSVADQTVAEVNLIVVEAGECSENQFILEQCEVPLIHIKAKRNATTAQLINAGLKRVQSPIVGVLEAQDLLLPSAIQKTLHHFEQNVTSQWLVLDGIKIDEYGHQTANSCLQAPENLRSWLMHNTCDLPLSGAFFKTNCLNKDQTLDPKMTYAFAYDLGCYLVANDIQPTVLGKKSIARRELAQMLAAQQVIDKGQEYIQVGKQYANHIPLKQRTTLWSNLEERSRIYALAKAEAQQSHAKAFLWRQLLRHPWWLADAHYRHGLIQQGLASSPTKRKAA